MFHKNMAESDRADGVGGEGHTNPVSSPVKFMRLYTHDRWCGIFAAQT